jgi:phosphate starvation-inducible PhoH-like protein
MSKPKRLNVASNDINEITTIANKSFSVHNLVSFKPASFPQQQFFDSYDKGVPIIAQVGAAGTGKTACAIYAALADVFDKSTPYDKIVIVRSAVQARDIGFLPGTEAEKNEAFELPYKQLFNELLNFKSNNYENLKALNKVQFCNTSFLRGTTFNDAIVIVDEFENCTHHELATCITRLGTRSRLILCGDIKQVDLHRKGDTSGLNELMEEFKYMKSSSYDIVNYKPEDCVRSGVVRDYLLAQEERAKHKA